MYALEALVSRELAPGLLRAAFEKTDFVWNLSWLSEDLLDDLY
tara:strand:- start:1609 stop:1737 length:129 start_codon:yes stop_codon:yes gene_type:complete